MGEPVAAVDVGSNSVRVLVLGADGAPLARELTITRLGKGVDATGRLDDGSLARTLDTLGRYRTVWESHGVGVGRVRIAATSAVRDATDRERFFAGVKQATGLDAQVLSGGEEARTAFAGVASGLDVSGRIAVLDVGGGSTELIVGDPASGDVLGACSLQLGSVRLTEQRLHDDPPTPDQLVSAASVVQQRLDEADDELPVRVDECETLVGVAGTATTLAAVALGLDSYVEGAVHGQRIAVATLRSQFARLARLSASQRGEIGAIQPGREDVIVGGAAIVLGVMERYGFEYLLVSESDILDGLAHGLR